ncbi:GTP 3',8-cyclase MoaA [Chitiniphilus eburneus]|uniref:GTP 3',8-cyclase n=1 Tax=Chitiniphilus eburneus TaxID=2571148 RepID=A0A4U0PFF4_9NEIS|nr:GTP 3',8-cyclase MoaA [Chitiniphilus eburneus]TJZ66380.1 GTP 3',8-cyclase MoaA [Chitiniphilus eburneus]
MSDSAATTALIDPFGRRIDYLRVSVTDRCDLRCTYCLPKGFKGFEEPAHWLRHAEMLRLVGLFVRLGVGKVRLTGGEPLLRRGVADLATGIAALPGLVDLSMSTNGTQLAALAAPLKAAGVHRLNVSLDTLDRGCFARITGADRLDAVLAGLSAAKAVGLAPIKLNMVVQGDVNEHDVERMVAFSLAQGFVLRLIETMPMGDTGRSARPVDVSRLGARLAAEHGLLPAIASHGAGPARYWADADGRFALGVITPLSQHFCAACNRVRLTVDGTLHLCLGQEDRVPLGAMLRDGASDDALIDAIRAGIAAKPERHDFNAQPGKIVRFMAQTGG